MNRFLPLAIGFALLPFSATSLAQTSLLEFRWDRDPGYVSLDYRISNNESRRRSRVKLILPGKVRDYAMLELRVVAPETFNKWRGRIDVDSVKVGYDCIKKSILAGTRTKCEDYFTLAEVTQVTPGEIRITPDTPIPESKDIVVELKMRNPAAGFYQFNGYAIVPSKIQLPLYQGSWLVEID